MKRILFALFSLALIAASCGDDSAGDAVDAEATDDTGVDETADADSAADEPADDTGEPPADDTTAADDTEPVELFASHQGVTAEQIDFGVASIDAEALLAFDVDLGVAPVEELYVALSAAQNERGGVFGRDLVPHTVLFLPVGAVPQEEACLKLTADMGVFAVIGQLLGDNPLCVTEQQGLPYIGHFGLTTDVDERSQGRFVATEMSAEVQRYGSVSEMIAQGDLDGKSVALWWDNPVDELFADLVRPLLEDAGIPILVEFERGDFGQDTTQSEAAADAGMLRILAEQPDVIIGLSGILPVTEAAERNGYGGTIAFTNGQAADQIIFPEVVASEEVKARTFAITVDKPTPEEALADPGVVQCIDEFTAMFPDEPLDLESTTTVQQFTNHCRAFRLMVLILGAAGADLNPASFVAAADGLGTFDLPAMADAQLSSESRSAGSKLRRYEFDAEAGFHLPVGDPIDPPPLP